MKENKKFKALKAGLGNGLVIELDRAPVAKRKKVKIDNTKWAYNQTVDEHYLTVAGYTYGFDEHITPHLFPLSMLTKPIRIEGYNDGKEFVPIEELFPEEKFEKMEFDDREGYGWIEQSLDDQNEFELGFSLYNGLIGVYYAGDWQFDKLTEPIWCIGDMNHTNKLHQWHLNVFNLDESEFIDASISKCYEPK